jgi:hypothetical protein
MNLTPIVKTQKRGDLQQPSHFSCSEWYESWIWTRECPHFQIEAFWADCKPNKDPEDCAYDLSLHWTPTWLFLP